MRHKPLFYRIAPFTPLGCPSVVICGISKHFYLLSPCKRQVAHALLTRPPLSLFPAQNYLFRFVAFSQTHSSKPYICKYTSLVNRFVQETCSVRLACFKHAASVRPEPGSNSNVIGIYTSFHLFISSLKFFLYSLLTLLTRISSCNSFLFFGF